MNLEVLHAPAFEDNYIWFATSAIATASDSAKSCVVIDPGDADVALDMIASRSLEPVAIFCTHLHGDHVGGLAELQARFDVPIYGPELERIRGVNHAVGGGETITLDGIGSFEVLATPGHTAGHISYFGENALFCGDTLFSAGCGRLFNGTAEQLFHSLKSLRTLPATTRVYCAHEYTLSNLRFAHAVEPANQDIQEMINTCKQNRQNNIPTLPSTIQKELQINPFLRTEKPTVRSSVETHVGHALGDEVEVFTELRRWKDGFSG